MGAGAGVILRISDGGRRTDDESAPSSVFGLPSNPEHASLYANFLCPNDPAAGATYLLDWQSPTVDINGYDLANLCATFWTPEQRHAAQREQQILRRYHSVLQAHGVADYTWDDLLTDYRTGLIYWLLVPLQDRFDSSGKDYWWPKMQCLVAAFREWRCAELLGMPAAG